MSEYEQWSISGTEGHHDPVDLFGEHRVVAYGIKRADAERILAALNASHGAAGELARLREAYRAAYEVGGSLAALVWSQEQGFPIAVGHVGKILMEWQTLAAPAASPTAPDGESGI